MIRHFSVNYARLVVMSAVLLVIVAGAEAAPPDPDLPGGQVIEGIVQGDMGPIADAAISLSESIRQSGRRVSISAYHERPGYRERSSQRERIWLAGSHQAGNTRFRGTALPLEPLVLMVQLTQRGQEPIVLHQQHLVLNPGETHMEAISLD